MRPSSSSVASVLLSAALLSGCGVGLHAQTYKESGRSDGTSQDLESLAIRNLHIEPPASGSTLQAGSQAVLTGGLVNRGQSADTLTGIATDVAGSVSLLQGGQPVTAVTVPAGGTPGEWSALLQGLSSPLRAGSYVSVTLTFANAGRTTVRVPVDVGDAGLGSREVKQHPYGEGG